MTKDYEVVRANIKASINSDKNVQYGPLSITKIGPDWVEFNNSSYERFTLNPETNRLEQFTPRYDLLEWVEESLEQIREAHQEAKTFRVGDGVRWACGSDCYPGTVINVTPRYIEVQDDEAIPYHRDIHSESQEWDYIRNPMGAIRRFYKKRDGYFGPKGSRYGLVHKGRHKYHDPHF